MFTDEIKISFKAGDGGNGIVSFFPGKKSGPDGGNGGSGGNLFIKADRQLSNLNGFVGKKEIKAEDGKMGGRNRKSGANGKDLELSLPVGSFLTDINSKEEFELISENQKILICFGGKGGKGNAKLRSASNTTPMFSEKGGVGQIRHFNIILRMIADFGLIGLPNTGKSSLLNELTKAHAKVAGYPFTTIEPNLGVINGKVIADIPGLIEGAHLGKGLGISFLKHIEKVKMLLHCISSESENIASDYLTIVEEMKKYNPDLLDPKELDKKVKQLKKLQKTVLPISILDPNSLDKLKDLLALNPRG